MSRPSSFSPMVLPLLVLACAGGFCVSCGSPPEKSVEQITEETHPIDQAGTLSIRNPLGSVRIYGSNDSEMKLKAIKKAWSNDQLNGITVAVSGQAGALSLETSFPARKKTSNFSDRSGSVDCVIVVPRTVRISRLELGNGDLLIEGMSGEMHANLVNGALESRNCFGNAQLSVANGGLNLFYEKWNPRPFSVDAKIISGNARAFLPREASFHIVAETALGNIANHLATAGGRQPRRANKVSMSVGPEAGSDIVIRATNGDIEIAPAKVE